MVQTSPNDEPFFYVMTIYLVPLVALMIIAEIRWERVLKYISFLERQWGKGIYYILIAMLLFDPRLIFDMSVSVFMTIVGIFNLVCSCLLDKPTPVKFWEDFGDSEYDSETETDDAQTSK